MVNIKIKIILQLLGSYIAQIISAFEKDPLKAAAFRNLLFSTGKAMMAWGPLENKTNCKSHLNILLSLINYNSVWKLK